MSVGSDRLEPGWALLPLRLFLGGTFVFAGLQKLASPSFFDASSSSSIQAQIKASAPGSPIHPLLTAAGHAPVVVGVLFALAELAAGLGALAGLFTRVAAGLGMIISAVLFLSVSYHASPYYTGSDVVFFFAWTPLALGGAGGVWSLDALRRRRAGAASRSRPDGPDEEGSSSEAGTMGRRRFVVGAGITVLVGMAGAALASGLGRVFRQSPASSAQSHRPSSPVPIAKASSVPVDRAVAFSAPGSGDAAWLLQPSAGEFVAFDAICPHAHCQVSYEAPTGQFVCPCHGSRFQGTTGAVLQGPAVVGLTRIPVSEGGDGRLYAE
jgi:thiosulfate dehydrogenase (quinone) large subunit